MKIEIDFDNKVIEVKDSTTLGELVDKLKELNLKDWKEFKLKHGTEYIYYPWYIPQVPYYPTIPTYITEPFVVDPGTGTPPLSLPYTICSINN